MATLRKCRFAALRVLLAILVAYLPLQSLAEQGCCEDESAAQHADGRASTIPIDHDGKAWDCCSCCESHASCGGGTNCSNFSCSHAVQFIPVPTFDGPAASVTDPPAARSAAHSDPPLQQQTKPPKRYFFG
jgi:hypothetical protein